MTADRVAYLVERLKERKCVGPGCLLDVLEQEAPSCTLEELSRVLNAYREAMKSEPRRRL